MTTGVKFSELPVTPALVGQELIPILQNGLNRTTTISALTGAVGQYALENTNLINTLSGHLLGEIQDNDTLIDTLSTIGIETRSLLDTRVYELSSAVNSDIAALQSDLDSSLQNIRSEIVSVSAGAGSPVFVTNVNNINGLEQLTYQSDTVPSNHIVSQVTMDDDSNVQVTIEWDGPATEWMGTAYINESQIPVNDITRIGSTRRFTASKTVDLAGASEIVARVNSETYTVNVNTLGGGPAIQNISFSEPPTVNGYTPDYFLDGDEVDIVIEFDTSDVSSISLYSGNSYATDSVVDQPISTIGSPPSAVFTATIDMTSNTLTNLPIRISAKNSFGTEGDEHVSVATIPCRAGPGITNVTYGGVPSTNGFVADYFMDGENVQVTAEFDNANVSNVRSFGGSSFATLSRNSIAVSTVGNPPSATFTATVDTNVTSITNQNASFAARSNKSVIGNTHNTARTIPVKYGPDITNITVSDIPTTGGYQPTFYMSGDPLTVVVELDTANVVSVGRTASGNYANSSSFVNVSTTGTPPSATFTTYIDTNNLNVQNKGVSLAASGPANRYGSSREYAGQLPVKIGPDITNVSFGAYPGIQTELKDNDTIEITIEYDTNNVSTTQSSAGSQYAGNNMTLTTSPVSLSATANLTIDTSVTTPTQQSVRLRARSVYNQYGNYHNSVDKLTVNNVRPTFQGWNVSYPNTQTALKQGDVGTVSLTINNQGANPTINYTSPGNQVAIADQGVYSVSKTVTCNSVGAVNESSNNYKVDVHRRENDTNASYSNVIYIADIAPTISIDSTQTMRSGGSSGTSAQIYSITARSNQYLSYYDMDAATGAGSVGNWNNASQNRVWSSQLTVNDTDTKGTSSWANITATNRAGITTTSIATRPDYTLGGFVSRTLTIPSLSRTVSIGTHVHNTSKLTATETFRGTITFDTTIPDGTTIDPSLDSGIDVTNKFTIVDSSNPTVVDYNGDTFFYLDKTAASNNVSGTSQLVIEETT